MKLPVLLAFCIGFASSLDVYHIQPVKSEGYVEPHFAPNDLCSCTNKPLPQCGCCYDFELAEKSHNICSNITYVEGEKALRFTVVYDGNVFVNETLSATNPPPFCQGIKPAAYICEKYSNISYGDDNKWGGCLEIYGGVIVQIIDVKFGCFYLPVNKEEMNKKITETPDPRPLVTRFKDVLKDTLAKELKRWYGNKFGSKRPERLFDTKSGISLHNLLFKNRLEDAENEGIEVPDI